MAAERRAADGTVTKTALNKLFRLWQDNLNIGNDADRWRAVVFEAGWIVSQAEAAADPDFIKDFSFAVIDSLMRINIEKGTG